MRRLSPAMFVWLVVVWLMLWGTFDVTTLLFGIVVALVVLVLFPLPAHRWNVFARPSRVLGLAWFVARDIAVSAMWLAWDVFRHRRDIRAAIVAVPLLSDADHVIASAANVLSLGPGKFVLQIDRERSVWYVYALGAYSRVEADRVHDDTLDLQARVVRTFAPATEADAVRDRAEQAKRARRAQDRRHP